MENNPKKKNKKSLLDFKNLSTEEKQKFGAIGVFVLIFCGIMYYGISNYSSDSGNEEVVEFSNPEAEQSKYNTKLDALNPKENPQSSNDLEYTFNQKEGESQNNSVDFEQLDRQLAQAGNVRESQPIASNNTTTQSPSNSHNVYGDYDMWQNKEPSNSKIGYSNKSNVPSKTRPVKTASTPHYETVSESAISSPVSTPIQSYEVPTKNNLTNTKVRAKLITQGYASSGKSISFVLLEPTTIAGKKTKKGQVITGTAKEQNNRLSVNFSEVKIDGQRYPVSMQLIGFDGYEGFPISTNATENNSQIKDRAINETNRIPVVGGVISTITAKKVDNRLKLGGNVECTIAIFN